MIPLVPVLNILKVPRTSSTVKISSTTMIFFRITLHRILFPSYPSIGNPYQSWQDHPRSKSIIRLHQIMRNTKPPIPMIQLPFWKQKRHQKTKVKTTFYSYDGLSTWFSDQKLVLVAKVSTPSLGNVLNETFPAHLVPGKVATKIMYP